MNTKIIAAVIVIVLVIAGVGVYFLLKDTDKEINIISGVNTDGSGIYIKESINKNDMFDFSTPVPTPKPSGWEGKVFGTPGISTIQHVQLLQIVEGMGMNFAAYVLGENNNAPNTVYFISSISNAVLALGNTIIDGGSLWQPQYQKIVDDESNKFKELVLTNDLFPGHACCVIAGYHGYTSSHADETVRFLAAYITAVDWVNAALSDDTSADYQKLIEVAKNVTGGTFTDDIIEEALSTVVYTYGENSGTPLAYLFDQIPSLAENLVEVGATSKTLQDLGFKNGEEFADKFVDDSFLIKALELLDSGNTYSGSMTNLKVAVITGDIHQIAMHIAAAHLYKDADGKDLPSFFEEFGLNVSFSGAVNGPGVATAIQNGDASFGLLGAPPITITVINGELVKA
ncbi:MAG: hypothetical protein FWG60_00365 [Methanomassiliicoccaceae archaeon]|nr:hypothetical protein [Methanomassiliicoccaceae archaeon]